MQEREAKTDLTQTHHAHEESMLVSALLISAISGKPGSVLNERESSQGLEDELLMSALQVQQEQILAEAKFDIQKYEKKKQRVSINITFTI